jgi:hypothetical protein
MMSDYLDQGTQEATRRRLALIMTFLGVGRAGECGRSTWNGSYYDLDGEFLFMNWNEVKTSAQKPMPMNCDMESFELDFFHACACYFIMGLGRSSEVLDQDSNWILPFMANLTGNGMCCS